VQQLVGTDQIELEVCSTTRVPFGSVSDSNDTVVGSIKPATSVKRTSLRPDLRSMSRSWRTTA
jgi:hypothetical protein